MTRSVFDLPLRLRRTYMAAVQLMEESGGDRSSGSDVRVRDVDIAAVTLHHVSETRLHLLDLASDLLEVRQDDEHVYVTGRDRSATPESAP